MVEDVFDRLRKIDEDAANGSYHPLFVKNADYYLCFGEELMMTVVRLWDIDGRRFPILLRSAKDGVPGCVVLELRDRDGMMIDFLNKVKDTTHAKVIVREYW